MKYILSFNESYVGEFYEDYLIVLDVFKEFAQDYNVKYLDKQNCEGEIFYRSYFENSGKVIFQINLNEDGLDVDDLDGKYSESIEIRNRFCDFINELHSEFSKRIELMGFTAICPSHDEFIENAISDNDGGISDYTAIVFLN